MDEEKVIRLKETYKRSIVGDQELIAKLEKEREINPGSNDYYDRRIAELKRIIGKKQDKVSFMRPDNIDDLDIRESIKDNFAKKIDSIIPDGIPIVFHGRPNLGTIKKIIRDGGLTTPDERGESFRSFATSIDVGTKKDLSTVLDFADPRIGSGFPYGAIFAFYPSENEKQKVLETLGSEVDGGVESVSFRDNPERLMGIISTSENIQLLKSWCEEYGIDPNKVFTHEAFLIACELEFADTLKNNGEAKVK